jgi:hypothetical protein
MVYDKGLHKSRVLEFLIALDCGRVGYDTVQSGTWRQILWMQSAVF